MLQIAPRSLVNQLFSTRTLITVTSIIFKGLERFREQGLPGKLPADRIESLKRDPNVHEPEQEVQRLENVKANRSSLSEAKKKAFAVS